MSTRTTIYLFIVVIIAGIFTMLPRQSTERIEQQKAQEWQRAEQQIPPKPQKQKIEYSSRNSLHMGAPGIFYQDRVTPPAKWKWSKAKRRWEKVREQILLEAPSLKRVLRVFFDGRDESGVAPVDSYEVLTEEGEHIYFFDIHSDGEIDDVHGYQPDTGKVSPYFTGKGSGSKNTLTTEKAQDLFDEVLRLVQIPLPKKKPKMM